MAKDNSTLILLAGGAAVAYYGYTRGWFASFGLTPAASVSPSAPATTPASTPSAPAGTPAAQTPPVSSTSAGGGTAAASSTPSASVNTLANVFSQLKTAEAAAFGAADPALTGSASNPVASYDVHNWYLVNRTDAGLTDGQLQAPDHTTQISLTDYWAWAAPQLQQAMPGLTGLGYVYAGLGAIARMQRGW